MAHAAQDRYSDLVLAKLRAELVLADGFVFNNDYEGDPKAGAVKVPVRDTEVTVSAYDKADGLAAATGTTTYKTLVIDKDKAVNELIDGYDAAAVPDGIIAERLDSAGYSLARQTDIDGATALLAGATVTNVASLTKDNIYANIIDIRTDLSKANVPDDGRRYLLVTPDTFALILKSPEFISASDLGDAVKQNGILGKIGGFLVKEWNDTTANLAMIAGHPRFATRVAEWSVPVHVQDLGESGKYIGACAVQGRRVYGHAVLRATAIRAVYAPGSLTVTLAASDEGKTVATVTAGNSGTTYKYTKNPSSRVAYGTTATAYGGTSLTSGTTKISVAEGDVLEIVNFVDSAAYAVAYVTVKAADIGTGT
jgi:hypothetical protein